MPNPTKPPGVRQPARHWLLAAGAALFTIAALAGLHFLADIYLRSAAFNKALDNRISNYLHADGHFSGLEGDCPSLRAGKFEAADNGHGSAFAHIAAEDIRASLSPAQLILHHLFYLDNVEAQKLDVELGGGGPANLADARPGSNGFEVGDINIHQLNIAGIVRGMQLSMKRTQTHWTFLGAGGSTERAGFPPLAVEKAEGEASADNVALQRAILHGAAGTVLLHGNVPLNGERVVALDGTIQALPLEFILPNDWRAQIRGPVSGSFDISGSLNDLGKLETTGHLTMDQGIIEALPIFRSLERFREVNISNSSADFTAAGSEIQIRNLLLESPGLCRIQGSLTISPSGALSGELQFGVAPADGLTGIVQQVFAEAHDGYLWTSVHVSGTTRYPAEDLSPRISSAAANAIKAKGSTALKGAANFLGNLINN